MGTIIDRPMVSRSQQFEQQKFEQPLHCPNIQQNQFSEPHPSVDWPALVGLCWVACIGWPVLVGLRNSQAQPASLAGTREQGYEALLGAVAVASAWATKTAQGAWCIT